MSGHTFINNINKQFKHAMLEFYLFLFSQDGDAVFPITGPWGHNPEAHEFTEVPAALL